MIKAKIIDLLKHELNDIGHEYRLYIVADDKTCFYVGQSIDVVNRLWEHLGQGVRPNYPSLLGLFIKRNLPESREFDILFMRPDEVDQRYRNLAGVGSLEVDSAERDMIHNLNPCFNVIYNISPRQLPTRYLRPIELNLEITVSDFVPFE